MQCNTTTLCQILGQEPEAADVAAVGDMLLEHLGDHITKFDHLTNCDLRRKYINRNRLEFFGWLGSMPARCAAFMAVSNMRLPQPHWEDSTRLEISRLSHLFIALLMIGHCTPEPLYSRQWWLDIMASLDRWAADDLAIEAFNPDFAKSEPAFHSGVRHFITLWAAWELKR